MEASGKLTSQDSTLVSLPCDREGLKTHAYGISHDCNEHLYETCPESHRQPKLPKSSEINQTDDNIIEFTRKTDVQTENRYGHLKTCVRPFPDRTINLKYTGEINVKSQSDKQIRDISGIATIASSKIIVADFYNNSIKMIDEATGSVITQIIMSSWPIHVISLPENKLAVTLFQAKCVHIVSYTETEFSLSHRIEVGEYCNGMAHFKDKIVVCCWGAKKIIIINFVGDIVLVFHYPDLFYGPLRVVIDNDQKFLYITDSDMYRKNKVVKIDWEGNVKNIFEEPGYNFPVGIQQLEDDSLIICYHHSDKLLRLSSSFKRCEIVGFKEANVRRPASLKYCNRRRKLYVSCTSPDSKVRPDIVKVFNVEWVI